MKTLMLLLALAPTLAQAQTRLAGFTCMSSFETPLGDFIIYKLEPGDVLAGGKYCVEDTQNGQLTFFQDEETAMVGALEACVDHGGHVRKF